MEDLTALSAEQLMAQALGRADKFLVEASRRIDTVYGKGFSRENPQVVAALVQAAATNFAGSLVAQQLALIKDSEGKG